jgi:hypothetical protein
MHALKAEVSFLIFFGNEFASPYGEFIENSSNGVEMFLSSVEFEPHAV